MISPSLSFYLFLFVFSLSIPIFYHTAFLSGFLSLIHLLSVKKVNFLKLDKYIFNFILVTFVGYVIIVLYPLIYGTYDFSYLKTYSNNFLSSLCAIPLASLYLFYYQKNAYNKACNSLFNVFFIQSLIIFTVILFPQFKPIIQFFQRNAEVAIQADLFSNGIRANALSGGLFFGLTISFSISLILFIHNYFFIENKKITYLLIIKLIIVNLAMLISGRFGAVYLFCLPFIFGFSISNITKLKKLFLSLILCALLFIILYYFDIILFKPIINSHIGSYVLEFFTNHGQTSSTNRLFDMYDLKESIYDILLGSGYYTNSDGSYYKHVDVGYLRLLLYGGVPFLILAFIYTFNLILPFRKCSLFLNSNKLWVAVIIFFILCSFKGEVMMTMVSVNSILFFMCLVIFNVNRKA